METQTAAAAPSAAQEIPATDLSRGPLVNWTPEQRSEFRNTGKMPEPPKVESAPTKTEEVPSSEPEEGKSEGEPEAPKKQQEHTKPKQTAEERIAQLEATIEKIRKGAGLEKAQPRVESPAPKPPAPQQPQYTRPKPTIEAKDDKGNPKYASYDDYVEDLADWKAEQRIAQAERERAHNAQQREFQSKLNEARSRYENFDEVIRPAVEAVVGDPAVSPIVKSMLNESDVLPDLAFTIGSKPDELASFVEMAKHSPGKAIRYIALTESLIRDELEAKSKPAPKAEPKETPVPPKTSAPKPPAEVGGRGSTPPDELESAAKASDFRRFKAEANRRDIARLKG